MILPKSLQPAEVLEHIGKSIPDFNADGIAGTSAVYLGKTNRELYVCSCRAHLPELDFSCEARAYMRPENGYLQQKRVLFVVDHSPAEEEQQ